MKTFPLRILTLYGVAYEENVDEVTVPTSTGEIGILAHHTPLVSLISSGELVIKKQEQEDPVYMAVSEGFIEVREGGETVILADIAERAEDIDIEEAKRARERAEEALKRKDIGEVDFVRFQSIVNHEMARIKVAHAHLQNREGKVF